MIVKGKKLVAFATVLCLLLCLLSSCGLDVNRAAYELPETFETIESQTVASNDKFSLEWDDDYKSLMLHSKETGDVWGTTPYDFYAAGEDDSSISSPIIIEAIGVANYTSVTARAYSDAIEDGYVSAKKIDNGVEVTYYFDRLSISIPVQYVLRGDSLAVSVDTTKITEGDEYMLRTISVAPYMCSVANDTEGGYLFVPAGNGALMHTDIDANGKRAYKGDVYGEDSSRYQAYTYYKDETMKMPVIGAKSGDQAIVGIIEKGAELGIVQADAGNKRVDYANVAAVLQVRAYDIYADEYSDSSSITTRVARAMTDETFTVGFYPLAGDKADYVGMAETYRDYLRDNGLVKSELAENAYALSILGNVETQSLAFGVPYVSTKSMTTFNEAADIIKELFDETKLTPAVQLKGYAESGLDIGQVAGGFGLASASGSKKDYAALTAYAKENNVPLFTDFDLVFFNAGGKGYGTQMDVAKTSTLRKSERYHSMLALRAQDKDRGAFYLLSRSKLSEAMEKLLKKGDKLGITGYNFTTLGQEAYSDYMDEAYFGKKGMAADVKSLFGMVSEGGHIVSADNANDYAVVSADTVFNVEVSPHDTLVLDQYVPFYQIVFKGYVPMYSEALNLTTEYESYVLGALESGIGLGYTVLKNYDPSFAATVHTNLYSSVYADEKELIVETVAKYEDYYMAIQGATITDHEILENGVTVTTFDNGVVAYTNNSATAKSCAVGELVAYGFAYMQGGTN